MLDINVIQSIFDTICRTYHIDPTKYNVVRKIRNGSDTEIIKVIYLNRMGATDVFTIKRINGVKKEDTLTALLRGWALTVKPNKLEIHFLIQYNLL